MRQIPTFKNMQKQIKMTITAEGLRIDLLETQRGLFFRDRKSEADRSGGRSAASSRERVDEAAEQSSNRRPYRLDALRAPDYSNWELSADRANAARRILIGIRTDGRPYQPGARLRGSAAAAEERSDQSVQPADLDHRAQPGLDQQEEKLAETPAGPQGSPAPAAASEKPAAVTLAPAAAGKK